VDEGTVIRDNEGGVGGGVYIEGGTCTFHGTATGNFADIGGGIAISNMTILHFSGTISGNRAAFSGGGAVINSSSSFILNSGTVENNNAGLGGAVYLSGGYLNLRGGEISGNTAETGGAVFVSSGGFIMSGGYIQNNRSSGNGGGVVISGRRDDTSGFMSGGAIRDNVAGGSGGGLLLSIGDFYMYETAVISGNIAEGRGFPSWGGGVFIDTNAVFTINGEAVIRKNRAARGAGIHMKGLTEGLLFESGIIEDNEASEYGGGIYAEGRYFSLGKNLIIQNNRAELDGGGLYIMINTITLESGIKILNNSAGANGGGVYSNRRSQLIIREGVTMENNLPDNFFQEK
jgi:hypothetical protein